MSTLEINRFQSSRSQGWDFWLLVIGGALLIRAPFLSYFGMSIDAYQNSQALPQYSFLASQGRQGWYVLMRLLDGLGMSGPIQQYADILISVSLLCVASVLLWKSVFSNRKELNAVIAIGTMMFIAHPYQAEILTFRDAAPFYAISALLGCAGYYLAVSHGRLHFSVGVSMIVGGLTIYQTFINFLAIIWLIACLLYVAAPQTLRGFLREDLSKVLRMGLLAIVTSLVAYLILIKSLDVMFAIRQDGRAQFVGWGDIPGRAKYLMAVIFQMLKGDVIVHAPITSFLTTALSVAGVATCFIAGRGRARFLWSPVIFVVMVLASVGAIIVSHVFWPVPRVLVGYALLPAFGTISLFLMTNNSKWQASIICLCGIMIISYTAIGSTVAADQIRVNRRDMLTASMIAERLSLVPHAHVAIVGSPDLAYGLTTRRGDMNLSAYFAMWSKTTALSEFLGYQIDPPTDTEFLLAKGYCANAKVWPAPGSTARLESGVEVVCFSAP